MARHFDFTIRLVSDAEPSSGFGTELVNSLVPRSTDGYPIIPASHIKGLMKQALLDVIGTLNPEGARYCMACVFGSEGSDLSSEALFSLVDAKCHCHNTLSTVTRTGLTEYGTAKEGTLRTAEIVSVGSEFKGTVRFRGNPSPLLDTLARYALLSVMEIGGSRNRGCGACCVSIEGEHRTPGTLLRELLLLSCKDELLLPASKAVSVDGSSQHQVVLKLTFTALSPLCVPELPVVNGTNTICSGFVIPASAVQGIVLHRINALESAVADACFVSKLFRVWPMLPLIPGSEGLPVRVSTSHRISKLPDENGVYQFCDRIVESDPEKNAHHTVSLKDVDGVLAVVEGQVNLWRSSDMPRSISAHAVINDPKDRRNRFTVESIAVNEFSGMVLLPEDAAQLLCASLKENPVVAVGKARSVRGSGVLRAEVLPEIPINFTSLESGDRAPVFIAQSPLVVENENLDRPANEILKELVESSGWGEVDQCDGSVSILFGWNRHREGRQEAIRIIEPGSVFKLKKEPKNLTELLAAGIGGGRDRGCGAVLPHPGIVHTRYVP